MLCVAFRVETARLGLRHRQAAALAVGEEVASGFWALSLSCSSMSGKIRIGGLENFWPRSPKMPTTSNAMSA